MQNESAYFIDGKRVSPRYVKILAAKKGMPCSNWKLFNAIEVAVAYRYLKAGGIKIEYKKIEDV